MSCAAPLRAELAREQRKVVTVLFCDLVGSTALGESTDPEALRARLRRYFEDLRAILERHGGSVEKFVGDAVMAVFGVPAAHEDDALRAARAAAEMREAVAAHGLEARIGINTGEVVVGGEGETLVTGDAVNVAARLEQAAAPGEILIGDGTRLLVRDAVRVEHAEPLSLKGKSEPVTAYRLLEVFGHAAPLARHLDIPLVGRARERQRLWRGYEDAVADRACHLFTLLGPAGIGKSRLVADFLERVGDSADVLRGRCLSYGEGITYWPLVDILTSIGVDPDSVIGTSPPETQLAFRRLLEGRAGERPQVVVIDDLQWSEPVFLELVEHIADLSRGVPIFLLVVARTELLDVRPDWGGGKLNAASLLLEPLAPDECTELMDLIGASASLDADLRGKITVASAGNPLFVEEMLAMVRERPSGGEIVVPPTIHALLQARIDSLDGDVRVVMERGAVEGEVFHRGTVAELSPDPVRDGVETHLATLVRKELIRSTAPSFPEDEGFRFRHLLIRDAAYESLPKSTRAELHERFADWLAKHDLIERDEIVGYHLEQAHRYRSELDGADPALEELARRASTHLAAAGRGALERGDFNAGRSLFIRATTLLPDGDEARLALGPVFAEALFEAGAEDTWKVLSEAARAADPTTCARATVTMATWAIFGEHEMPFDEREALRNDALSVFESTADDYGLALYWSSVAWEAWFVIRATEAAQACEHALEHFRRAGAEHSRPAASIRRRLRESYYQGPTPVDEAIERIIALGAPNSGLLEVASEASVLARLYAMKGEIDDARELLVRGARQAYRDAGLVQTSGGMTLGDAEVEFRAGDFAAEERALRQGLEALGAIGDSSYYPTVAAVLAECLYRQGADDAEIEELCERVRSTTGADDLSNFVWLDLVTGALHSRRGDHEEADRRTANAVALADRADFHFPRTSSRVFRAEALARAGRLDDAASTAAEAFEILDAKGDVAGAEQFRVYLAGVGVEVA
jgi:class 3 adenylate cyclase/tetratricopeptide (TPR) repeat protein